MIHEIKKHSLYAFYDLSVAPLTFDFLQFLVLADIERSKKKLSDLTVVIIPATEETRDPGLKDRFSRSDRNWRLNQILAPACALLPSCSGKVMICGSREDGANVVEFAGNNIFPLPLF